MINYITAKEKLKSVKLDCDIKEYKFAVLINNKIPVEEAYVLAYLDREKINEPFVYKSTVTTNTKKAKDLAKKPNVLSLVNLIGETATTFVLDKLGTDEDAITPAELKSVMTYLIRAKTKDDSVDFRELNATIKWYADNFMNMSESDTDKFNKQFAEFYPKFNMICNNCNREIDGVKGVRFICPHCKTQYDMREKKE